LNRCHRSALSHREEPFDLFFKPCGELVEVFSLHPVFSFDAFQAPGERLAMKKTQYSNTPAAESPSFPEDKPALTWQRWIGL